jgi:hypothetical protein
MGKSCSTHGNKTNACKVSVGKPHGRRLLGRPSHTWDDNIKIDIRGIVWSGLDWINLALYRD